MADLSKRPTNLLADAEAAEASESDALLPAKKEFNPPALRRGSETFVKPPPLKRISAGLNPVDETVVSRLGGVLKVSQVLLLTMILLQSILAMSYVFIPGDRPAEHADYLDEDDTAYADMTYVIAQAFGALCVLILMLIAGALLLYPITNKRSAVEERLTVAFFAHVLSCVIWCFCAAYPSPSRIALTYLGIVLSLVSMGLMAIAYASASRVTKFYRRKQGLRVYHTTLTDYVRTLLRNPEAALEQYGSGAADSGGNADAPLCRFERLLEINTVRRKLRKTMHRGSYRFLIEVMVVYFLFSAGFAFEFWKTISTRGELFSDSSLDTMNENPSIAERFGARTAATKVVMIVMDGFALPGRSQPDYKKWYESIEDDAVHYTIQVQLPSMSVPNWVTTITGVRPEISGVWGNLAIPETNFDTLFRQAKAYGLHRGITSSPWFSQLIKSQLPILEGDGTVAYHVSVTDPEPSAKEADERRAEALLGALKQKENPYQFFLAHFSNIDLQGHCCGVDPKYNKKDSYNTAIADTVKILEKVVKELDESTLLVVLADHGHKPRGGHGGHDPMLELVPAVFYKKGSKLPTLSYDGPKFGNEIWQNVDVVPTVAAYLGLPVPRQNQGVFIDKIMALSERSKRTVHLRDLFYQKREFVKAYIHTLNVAGDHLSDAVFVDNYEDKTDEQYRDGIKSILEVYDLARSTALELRIMRNVLVSLALCSAILCYFLWRMQDSTFASPTRIFGWLWCSTRPHWSNDLSALVVVLLGTTLHYVWSVLWFRVLYMFYGYNIWDSTFLHYTTSFFIYLVFALAPSTISALFVVRVYHWYVVEVPKMGSMHPIVFYLIYCPYYYLRCMLNISHANIVRMDYLYLCRHYILWANVLAICVLWILVSGYSFLMPPIFFIPLVDPVLWTYRFRVITVQLMSLPLLITSVLNFFVYSSDFLDWRRPNYDSVYLLWVSKHLRIKRQFADSELHEVKKLLESHIDVEDIDELFNPNDRLLPSDMTTAVKNV